MPEKEIAHIVTDHGVISTIWQWIVAGVVGVGGWFWRHIDGRVNKLESAHTPRSILEQHILDEDKQFDVLFKKHDDVLEKLTLIAVDVATIKGKLSQNHEWQEQK